MDQAGSPSGAAERADGRPSDDRDLIHEALRVLGIHNLVLAIHDVSFPSEADEDTGCGSPYTAGGARFLRFVRDLGFNGVQLGPQGEVSAHNPSPYDGTIFSRSTLSIALAPLTRPGRFEALLSERTLAELVAAKPAGTRGRAHHRHAFAARDRALREVFLEFRRRRGELADLSARLDAFTRRHAGWLSRDALYGPLCVEHQGGSFHVWRGEPELDRRLFAPGPGEAVACDERKAELFARHHDDVERYALCQLLAHEQHDALRALTSGLGLKLYGDLQIGFSPQDTWAYQSVFLKGYLMGAPPSRTNPEGQAWNYPVLDPAQVAGPSGPLLGLALVQARMGKMFDEFDGVRIDHPHGLVCPWVYTSGAAEPLRAVQGGARLFSSPDLWDHPDLARYAIPEPAQIDRSVPRYADDRVTSLSPEQVGRYAVLFEEIARCARARGRDTSDIVCEVLSTMPFPLKAVLERYGLGRFRVTQKANLDDPRDVYRSENAEPRDWIMVGTHDTPPLWRLLEAWERSGTLPQQARYLASRLAPSAADEGAMARELAGDPRLLAQAKLADLFASRATNVMVFFSDLLGLKETYNSPGTVSDDNWSLRVPPDHEQAYADRRARGAALDLRRALAMALRARAGELPEARRALALRLEQRAEPRG
jgi:4-alpha-glucanotransferase